MITNAHRVITHSDHRLHEARALVQQALWRPLGPITAVEQENVLLSYLLMHRLDHRRQARETPDLRWRISLQPSRRTRLRLSVHIVRVQDDEVALFDAGRRPEPYTQRD